MFKIVQISTLGERCHTAMVCFKKSLLFRAQKEWTIPNIEPDIF